MKNGWRRCGQRCSGRCVLNLLEARGVGSMSQGGGDKDGEKWRDLLLLMVNRYTTYL